MSSSGANRAAQYPQLQAAARFLANGTYTVPANASLLEIIAVGGGSSGAGGSSPATATAQIGSCGGTAGAEARALVAVVPGQQAVISIGVGGARANGGAGAAGQGGNAGADTIVTIAGITVTGKGASGGFAPAIGGNTSNPAAFAQYADQLNVTPVGPGVGGYYASGGPTHGGSSVGYSGAGGGAGAAATAALGGLGGAAGTNNVGGAPGGGNTATTAGGDGADAAANTGNGGGGGGAGTNGGAGGHGGAGASGFVIIKVVG